MVVSVVRPWWVSREWWCSVVGVVVAVLVIVLCLVRGRLGGLSLLTWCCDIVWSVARLSVVICSNVVIDVDGCRLCSQQVGV